jgi:hypothetical protein
MLCGLGVGLWTMSPIARQRQGVVAEVVLHQAIDLAWRDWLDSSPLPPRLRRPRPPPTRRAQTQAILADPNANETKLYHGEGTREERKEWPAACSATTRAMLAVLDRLPTQAMAMAKATRREPLKQRVNCCLFKLSYPGRRGHGGPPIDLERPARAGRPGPGRAPGRPSSRRSLTRAKNYNSRTPAWLRGLLPSANAAVSAVAPPSPSHI